MNGVRKKRRERGRIELGRVVVVEAAKLTADGEEAPHPPGFAFQLGYLENGHSFTLYLLAAREQDRADWIRALRQVCSDNLGLSDRFHEGVWNGRRWSCCRTTSRASDGCESISWSPRPAQVRLQTANSVGSVQQVTASVIPLQNSTPASSNSTQTPNSVGTVADASEQSARLVKEAMTR
ncbi:hypothetical protein B566_EDAN010203 [Ephemera danica]|nr:hypothetical protein B566_EDAN010203 [Ephemera danica]